MPSSTWLVKFETRSRYASLVLFRKFSFQVTDITVIDASNIMPALSVLFVLLTVVWVVTSCVVDTTLLVVVVVGGKIVVTALVDFGIGVVVVVIVLALVELEIIVVVEAVDFSDKEVVVIRD